MLFFNNLLELVLTSVRSPSVRHLFEQGITSVTFDLFFFPLLNGSGGMEIIYGVGYSSRIQASRMALKICRAVKNGILEPR